ncbi:MAG: hypothetical protein ABI698_06435 [bacterium]
MHTRPVFAVTRRAHNLEVAIFHHAAPATSWVVIPGRLNSRRHFALALVMQSICKHRATNATRREQECRSEDK